MPNEKELFEFLEGMTDIQRKAYEAGYKKGFEEGKRAKEKEIEDYFRWLDAKREELEEEAREREFVIKNL